MTECIFKSMTPLKKEVFHIVINEMLRIGWKQLNEGKENANDVYVMYSNGNDGKKNIYIELIPYDGRNMETSSERLNFDVRSSAYSDAFYKFCTGYNNDKGRGISPDESWPTSWFQGRTYTAGVSANGPRFNPDIKIEFYLFVDKERIITCTIPPISTTIAPAVSYIGCLGNLMLLENHEPFTRALVSYASSWSGNYTTANQGLTFNRPKGSNETTPSQSYRSSWLQIPFGLNPNIDNTFLLSPFYISSNSYGARGKLEGIYQTSDAKIVSGDILEIEVNGKIQKYKYVNAIGSYGALPAPLAFRIE
ncbi:hypothetical protein ACJTM1_09355 [Bacillus sp. GX]|uniref:hypothetical protein n=1 Tax=Bacillus TaxID=1386 RepID=UPI00234A46A7|nr:hypothetical protein [Bacillus albus]MDC6155627.1 hypothetical protein [Bacillus albus]MDD8005104.1 hypothetical protein [Bacillus albus]